MHLAVGQSLLLEHANPLEHQLRGLSLKQEFWKVQGRDPENVGTLDVIIGNVDEGGAYEDWVVVHHQVLSCMSLINYYNEVAAGANWKRK